MFEKTYIRKPRTIKAIQYDGSDDMMVDFCNEYRNIEIDWGYLYFTGDYSRGEISKGDWLVIEDGDVVVEVILRDNFADDYEIQRS